MKASISQIAILSLCLAFSSCGKSKPDELPNQIWSGFFGNGGEANPLLVNGELVLTVSLDSAIWRVNPVDGEVLQHQTLYGLPWGGPVLPYGNDIYTGIYSRGRNSSIICLANGTEIKWQTTFDGVPDNPPVIFGDLVGIRVEDRSLKFFDKETGKPKGELSFSSTPRVAVLDSGVLGVSQANSSQVRRYDQELEESLPRIELPCQHEWRTFSRMQVVDGKLFFPCEDKLVVYDLESGSVIKEVEIPGGQLGDVLGSNGKYFFLSNISVLHAIDAHSYEIAWTWDVDRGYWSGIVPWRQYVVLGNGGNLVFLDRETGAPKKVIETLDRVTAAPIFMGDTVILGMSRGHLVALKVE